MSRPPQTTMVVTPVATQTIRTSALGTEFGRQLETVMSVPGVLGVVLSDDRGYAIDYVLDPERMTPLDVQLIGAQLGQPMQRLMEVAGRRGMGDLVVVTESEQRRLVCTTIAQEYILAAMLEHEANLAKAMRRFETIHVRLETLLVG